MPKLPLLIKIEWLIEEEKGRERLKFPFIISEHVDGWCGSGRGDPALPMDRLYCEIMLKITNLV